MQLNEIRETREVNHSTATLFKDYILFIKGERCEMCGKTKNLEIHHKRYSLDVCVADLAILCSKCHHSISDYRNFNNPERMAEMSIATV